MMARRRRGPLAFAVFDIPHLAGEATTSLPYRDRRRLLELLELDGPAWCTVPSFDAEADEVLEECARLRLEGLVAKRVDSRYEPGKRSVALAQGEVRGLARASRAAATRALNTYAPTVRCAGSSCRETTRRAASNCTGECARSGEV